DRPLLARDQILENRHWQRHAPGRKLDKAKDAFRGYEPLLHSVDLFGDVAAHRVLNFDVGIEVNRLQLVTRRHVRARSCELLAEEFIDVGLTSRDEELARKRLDVAGFFVLGYV